jgi:hypothetical protein
VRNAGHRGGAGNRGVLLQPRRRRRSWSYPVADTGRAMSVGVFRGRIRATVTAIQLTRGGQVRSGRQTDKQAASGKSVNSL